MTLDSQYYRAFFGAYFVQSSLKTLEQTAYAKTVYENSKVARIDYNILIIQDDSQRWDLLNRHGYEPEETDKVLNWFYDKSYDFQYPISSANNTDTSVPATLTGKGSAKDILDLKNGLVIWDYFAKSANTFFLSTSGLKWAGLDKFYNSLGMKFSWDAASDENFRGNKESIDDSFLIQKWNQHYQTLTTPWIGMLQVYASHYP